MKKILYLVLILGLMTLGSHQSLAQEMINGPKELYTAHNKGKFFVYWGWNRGYYTKSDVHFTGKDYDFTIHNAKSHDKPIKPNYHDYLQLDRVTIPQTDVRVGYFISDHYNISLGIDHMKYVMSENQTAKVSGYINVDGEAGDVFNGTYHNTPTKIQDKYLHLEHTNGLNYVNFEFSRYDDLAKLFGLIWNTDIFQLNATEGIGAGILVPKTNATILDRKRYDEFHLAGFGVSVKEGINLTFLKHFFVQGELKEGYMDLPDIRTTSASSDKASQHFFFIEPTFIIGGIFRI